MTYAVNVPCRIGDEMSVDDDPYASLWDNAPPPHKPRLAERLFEFTRASDGRRMVVDVQFHGESYGWEAQVFEHGDLFTAHGAFPTRALAVQWADETRKFLEGAAADPSG